MIPAAEGDRERWNRKHASVQVGGWAPRAWLVDHRALLDEQHGRRALDVACGRGRETLYLAELGFDVAALDVSDVVVEALTGAARERELAVDARRVDLAAVSEPLEHGAYDVVTCFYFLLRPLLPALAAALAPGGLLFYETFTRDHVEVLGGDMNRDVLLDHGELLRAFGELRVLRYREAVIGDERKRAVASLVARRR